MRGWLLVRRLDSFGLVERGGGERSVDRTVVWLLS